MWIMIIRDIPVSNPPPKYGIFWAVPWVDDKYMEQYRELVAINYIKKTGKAKSIPMPKKKRLKVVAEVWEDIRKDVQAGNISIAELEDFPGEIEAMWGYDPTYVRSVKIIYGGEEIRLWDYEYSIVDEDRLREYIKESHTLELDDVPTNEIVDMAFNIDSAKIGLIEAALLEGASMAEAKAMALGLYTPGSDSDILPLGWYRIKEEYLRVLP